MTTKQFMAECVECGRTFDLLNNEDVNDLIAGHDCPPEDSDPDQFLQELEDYRQEQADLINDDIHVLGIIIQEAPKGGE